ncbi:MAG: response regulator, partial [Planctomycetaceae bacterium]
GYIVRTFSDGAEFFEAVENGPEPDCLILGMRGSGMDGPAVLQELELRGLSVPVIAMSSRASGQIALDLGAVDFLRKPCREDELLRSIERAINSRRGPCPQCKGTGQYVGLNVIEACDACNGTGRV